VNFDDILMRYKYRAVFPYIERLTLLDVGCNTGHFIHMLNNHYPLENFHGLDQDCEAVKIARKYVKGSFYCLEFEQSNYSDRWGTITSFNVLEHVKDEWTFLERCYESLEKGGRLIVTVPNARALHKRIGDFMGVSRPYKLTYADFEKGHVRVYDARILEEALKYMGFRIVVVKGIFLKSLPSDLMMRHYSRELFDALYSAGRELSDYCSSVMAVGEKL